MGLIVVMLVVVARPEHAGEAGTGGAPDRVTQAAMSTAAEGGPVLCSTADSIELGTVAFVLAFGLDDTVAIEDAATSLLGDLDPVSRSELREVAGAAAVAITSLKALRDHDDESVADVDAIAANLEALLTFADRYCGQPHPIVGRGTRNGA